MKTGLRFDFYTGEYDRNRNDLRKDIVSVLEKDVFTFEAVFYKLIDNYSELGHWRYHTVNKQLLMDELENYLEYIRSGMEQKYDTGLTRENFGNVYNDIKKNRESVIILIENFYAWVNSSASDIITICGI
jgi:hypothetical protein